MGIPTLNNNNFRDCIFVNVRLISDTYLRYVHHFFLLLLAGLHIYVLVKLEAFSAMMPIDFNKIMLSEMSF